MTVIADSSKEAGYPDGFTGEEAALLFSCTGDGEGEGDDDKRDSMRITSRFHRSKNLAS